MIGDTPRDAPLRCKAGIHTGQDKGGLMVFQCPRCGGSYWQTDPERRAAMRQVKAAEDREDYDAVRQIASRWGINL